MSRSKTHTENLKENLENIDSERSFCGMDGWISTLEGQGTKFFFISLFLSFVPSFLFYIFDHSQSQSFTFY